jgi:hypothetical protein
MNRRVMLTLFVAAAGAAAIVATPGARSAEPAAPATPTVPPFVIFEPSPLPLRSPDPAAVEKLLASLPAPFARTCVPLPTDDELAAVSCAPAAGTRLSYRLMESAEALYGAYSWAATVAFGDGGMLPRTGACDDGGIQGMWPADGEPIGRFLCYERSGEASITWTHDALRTIAYLGVANANHAAAYELWLTAGPELPDASHSTASPEVHE